MRPRPVLLLAVLTLALAAAPAAAQEAAPTPTPTPQPQPTPEPPRIAPGVHAGGVDLSGMTVEEAELALAPVGRRLLEPIDVSVARKEFTLKPRGARLDFDALRTAKRAYYAGRDNPPAPGERLDVALAVDYRKGVVRRFVKRARKALYVKPRNARVRITVQRVLRRKQKAGRALRHGLLRRRLAVALVDPGAKRRYTPGRRKVKPKVRMKHLRARYRTVITIDRSSFRLRLFKRFRLARSYGIAVGLPAYPTPSGLFSIRNKAVNPVWTAPNSPWAGEMAGQQVAGGAPNNPLKARWMGIVGGVGIHGTGQEWSIGSRASHGCIRMRVADVISLYPRVPVGTPVLIR